MIVNKKILLPVLSVLLVLSFYNINNTKLRVKDKMYNEKIEASIRLEKIIHTIKEYRIDKGDKLDTKIDINSTGIIGLDYSEITTTIGALESKRTTTNPNMAAMVVELLLEAGLKKDDVVAVNCSGSFPALNFAVIAAAETIGIKPIIISSLGASTYGANNPELTYLDMERIVYERGLISHKSEAYSYGGANDLGEDMNLDLVKKVSERNKDYNLIYVKDFNENIKNRMKIYNSKEEEIDVLVNVGGNIISQGKKNLGNEYKNGYIDSTIKLNNGTDGLIYEFLNSGIDVINLLNIQDLALDYGLPIDPTPIPKVGEGEVYYKDYYNFNKIVILLILAGIGVLSYGYIQRKENKLKSSL